MLGEPGSTAKGAFCRLRRGAMALGGADYLTTTLVPKWMRL